METKYKYITSKLGDGFNGTGDIFSASFVAAMLKPFHFIAPPDGSDYVYRCINHHG